MRMLCGTILSAVAASAAFGDSLGNIGDVRLKGYLGERLDATAANILVNKYADVSRWRLGSRASGRVPISGGYGIRLPSVMR